MEKEAFEKIRSNIEKKKLFEFAIREKSIFTLKTEDDTLFNFTPREISKDHVAGSADLLPILAGKQKAIGNFGVGQDRFFFHGFIEVQSKDVHVSFDVEVFKLQRRKTLRIAVPLSYPMYMNITSLAHKKVFLEAKVHDISAGGLRFYLVDQTLPVLPKDLVIGASIHPPSGKTIEISAVIRHLQTVPIEAMETMQYGTELVSKNPVTTQRMMALSMEVQRKVILGY
jgi:mannuronan synthase